MKKHIFISALFLIPFVTSAQTIAAGSNHSLALCSDSTVQVWGANGDGQLGNNSPLKCTTPNYLSPLKGIIAIAGGNAHSLALKNDSTVWAWGWNSNGQLGNGSNVNSEVPVQMNSLMGIIAIAGAHAHSLALRNDGTVWAWGHNDFGQLGNGTNISSTVPILVNSLTDIVAIAGGARHSLALKSDGTVWAWGRNANGELGNGTYANSNVPILVNSLTNITAIVGQSLALKNDGTVWAWGSNAHGQLGNGNNTDSNIPVQVSLLTNITSIAGGSSHCLALKNDSTVWTWGFNYRGQLGNGTTTNYNNVPLQVSSLTGITAIATGMWFSLAQQNDGTLWAWGDNSSGQLGNGTTTDSNIPMQVIGLCQVTTAVNEIEEGYSDTTHALTNIQQPEINNCFSVYPNPTGNSITVCIKSTNPSDAFTLRVTDGLSQIVYTAEIKDISFSFSTNGFSKQIDLSQLPKGIYFVELQPAVFGSSHNTTKRNITKLILQ